MQGDKSCKKCLKVCGKFHDVSSINSSSGGKDMQLINNEVEVKKTHIEKGHGGPVVKKRTTKEKLLKVG